MGLFDQLSQLAGKAEEFAASAHGTMNLVMPQELQNIQHTHQAVLQQLQSLEAGLPPGSNATTAIGSVRAFAFSYYRNLQEGGDPIPNSLALATIKANPAYHQLRSSYAEIESRLAALEKKYLGCTYGYKMADGTIQAPSMEWNNEQWQSIQASSEQQSGHCWLDNDHSQTTY